MFRAGDIAERKHNPECRRDDRQDRGNATDLLDCISSSRAVTRARLNLAYAEAKDEVEHRWEWIDAVAKALLQRKHLTKHEVEDIVRNVVYREDQKESRP